MEWKKKEFLISTDKEMINVDYVHKFLATSYWAENIPKEIVTRAIAGSLCFGMYEQKRQIGFARVITDEATFAYLADVFIDPQMRGKELGKWLIQVITQYPSLQGLRRFMLATKDAHGLYEQFGFLPMPPSDRWMHIHHPDLYKAVHQAFIPDRPAYLYISMNMSDDLQSRWWKLEEQLMARFGKKPDVESILFLIGIQELGDIRKKFTKEQKQDLMHIAVCTVLVPSGYYEMSHIDKDGWPHFRQLKPMPEMNPVEQENFLKDHILLYFQTSEMNAGNVDSTNN